MGRRLALSLVLLLAGCRAHPHVARPAPEASAVAAALASAVEQAQPPVAIADAGVDAPGKDAGLAADIHRIGPDEYNVTRIHYLEDVMLQGRLASDKHGKHPLARYPNVAAGSLPDKLGLESGDVLESIGVLPKNFLGKNQRCDVTFHILRHRKRIVLTYHVRPPPKKKSPPMHEFNLIVALSQAHAVPDVEDGKTIGIKVFGLSPGMELYTIGVRDGDLIQSINGISMPPLGSNAEQLEDVRDLTTDVVRHDKPLVLTYHAH